MTIVMIVGALAFLGRDSGRAAGTTTQAAAVAASYKDAIEAFRRDHGGRAPVWASASDWPSTPPASAERSAATAGEWGPIDIGAGGRPYLDRIPEALASGSIGLVGSASAASATNIRARIVYVAVGTRDYRLSVQDRRGGTWTTVCGFGAGVTPSC